MIHHFLYIFQRPTLVPTKMVEYFANKENPKFDGNDEKRLYIDLRGDI